MDKLPSVIGKAPSEMSLGEFKVKLKSERDRVRRGLDFFKNTLMRPKGRKKKATPATKLTTLLKEAGLSPQDMVKGIEMLKKLEAKPQTPPKEED